MRHAGFTQLQMIGGVVALGLLTALFFGVRSYINGVDERAFQRGAAETTAEWEERELAQQQEYAAEIDRLHEEKSAQAGRFIDAMAEADAKYAQSKKENADEKRRNDRIAADLRAGQLVLRDPGRAKAPAAGQADSGKGLACTPAAGASDGAAAEPGELSADVSEFLWGEANRADEVVNDLEDQLTFAQDTISAYYRLAKDCEERR